MKPRTLKITQIIFFCRYINDEGEIIIMFLDIIQFTNIIVNSVSIVAVVEKIFKKNKLTFKQCCEIPTNNGSIMAEIRSSAVKQMKDKVSSIVSIHCSGHRTSLASQSPFKVYCKVDKTN
jgi:hypothetical protein